ncbi:N-acetylmuramic acid 6-phosphate etherase [Reticulibacter mediterranei]|uniref:N-acetylmuramic acid 6-phosphate etherase n=1 Tax=Reticulibacter mediterranei TaxID=2778369 RepID=A0A8J3IJ17_9CHLR|nr:N-acetylmuramic acid 6-phosphate etherase [Reticulibacter mediterranei]GHO91665.1 N-acetylmuramic acid 6-phosphate etherase [Reticulibacter mediterranei]
MTDKEATHESSLNTLTTEQGNPASAEIDQMSPLEIVRLMNEEDAKVARAIELALPDIASAIEQITERMRQGGRLIYIGAGTSGRLGVLDASECPPTFGVSQDLVVGRIAGGLSALTTAIEGAEDSLEAGQNDIMALDVTAKDTVVGIAASGRTPYVLGAIAYAKSQHILAIGIACNPDTPLEHEVDIMIAPVVGPEIISGSTRLKAGTAQKMVLNMLSTGVMIGLGKTYGNLMVDVQATNNKLRQRATKIVQQLAGVQKEQAVALLQQTGGETKTAIIIAQTRVTPEEARRQLAKHRNSLRATLAALKQQNS